MVDDVLLAKAAIIERTLARIAEDYRGAEHLLATDLRRQDAILLNLQRACQAAIDGAMVLVRRQGLGLPDSSRNAFERLRDAGTLDDGLCHAMLQMVGFRNIAVHQYQALDLDIVRVIIDERLGDLSAMARLLVRHSLG